MTNPIALADLARHNYGPHDRCPFCGLVVYPNGKDWRDGSKSSWCWTGTTQHTGRLEGSAR